MKNNSFSEKPTIDLFGKVKKMSYKQFREFHGKYGGAGREMGYDERYEEAMGVGQLWTDEEIYRLLRSEKIGEERARRIVDKLLEGTERSF